MRVWTVEADRKASIFMLITYRLLKVKGSLLHVLCLHTHAQIERDQRSSSVLEGQ